LIFIVFIAQIDSISRPQQTFSRLESGRRRDAQSGGGVNLMVSPIARRSKTTKGDQRRFSMPYQRCAASISAVARRGSACPLDAKSRRSPPSETTRRSVRRLFRGPGTWRNRSTPFIYRASRIRRRALFGIGLRQARGFGDRKPYARPSVADAKGGRL